MDAIYTAIILLAQHSGFYKHTLIKNIINNPGFSYEMVEERKTESCGIKNRWVAAQSQFEFFNSCQSWKTNFHTVIL